VGLLGVVNSHAWRVRGQIVPLGGGLPPVGVDPADGAEITAAFYRQSVTGAHPILKNW